MYRKMGKLPPPILCKRVFRHNMDCHLLSRAKLRHAIYEKYNTRLHRFQVS